MARKKKANKSQPGLKLIGVGIVSLVMGLGLFRLTANFLHHSRYFQIKSIVIDSSVGFINKRDLARVKGKNIFKIDLKKVQKTLSYKYPQVSDLIVIKKLPDQIQVIAKKRFPIAQATLNERTVTIDEKAIVVSTRSGRDQNFPLILGIKAQNNSFELGRPLRGPNVRVALDIISNFHNTKALSGHKISKIDVEDISSVIFYLDEKLRIIIDKDNIEKKLGYLSLVLAQDQLNLKDVKYIDLRFKEPIIGKKVKK